MKDRPRQSSAIAESPRKAGETGFLPRRLQAGVSGSDHSSYGPSSEFLVTPESFLAWPDRDPAFARSAVVLELYERCHARVSHFLRRSVPADVADDLAQETFLKLLTHKNLEMKSISISYLFRIAQNLVRRRHRDQVRRRAFLRDGFQHDSRNSQSSKTAPSSGSNRLVPVDSEELTRAFQNLSDREHEVLRLIVCEGLSYATAAKVLGVPVSTVNNWKYRALIRLRNHIDHGVDHDGESGIDGIKAADNRRAPAGNTGIEVSGALCAPESDPARSKDACDQSGPREFHGRVAG